MDGREDKKSNDLFFTCSLIEYIARKTKNRPRFVAEKLGSRNLARIYDLADVYHSDSIDDVSASFIEKCGIGKGSFDNAAACMYAVPSHWDLGKVYKRLILSVADAEQTDVITALQKVFSSKISDMIENYNSDFYYQSNSVIFEYYLSESEKLSKMCGK